MKNLTGSLAACVLAIGAACSNAFTAEAQSFQMKITLNALNMRARTPCVGIAVTNLGVKAQGIDHAQAPWYAFVLYITRDGHPVKKGEHIRPTPFSVSRPLYIAPKQTLNLQDRSKVPYTSDPYCIAISHWGYEALAPGSYQMRIADREYFSPGQRDDILENRGFRSNIVNFRI